MNRTCLWNVDAHSDNKIKIWQDLEVLQFDPAPLQGNGMSVKFEEHLDEPTVQVRLLYDHLHVKYCTLYAGWEELTDRETNRQMIPLLDANCGYTLE